TVGYDALVVASGADPVRPPVPGLDHPRVFTIRSLDEAIELRRLLDTGTVRRATVVGAGYIGLETAEALVCAGIEVEVIEALARPAWVPLGPAANKTGRVAGTVAAGGAASFPGVVGTAVVKVFDLEVARTGLTLAEAEAGGLAASATDVVSRSRAKYYPGASPVHVRLVHAPDGRLLGGQLAGRE